jgi:dCTP deaminase
LTFLFACDLGYFMRHLTNISFNSYKELWQYIFPEHYQEKYNHATGLTGGGGDYPFYDIHVKQDVILMPEHRFMLASTIEYFTVPIDYYLVVHNKSSIARLGVTASFNTLIDNGFNGYITLEIAYYGNAGVTIKAGSPIAKVAPHKLLFPCEPYRGQYQNQPNNPIGSRVNL